MTRLIPLLLLLGSCGKDDDSGEPAVPPPGECPPESMVTWNSFAEGWIDTWCTGCHSATLAGEDRQGAPDTVNFDTYGDVVQYGERIRVLATMADPYMPPSGGTSEANRALMAEWIACGMPGGDDPVLGCQLAPTVGPTTLSDQAQADALCADGLVRVDGDLQVVGSEVSAGCVCAVSGQVHVEATGFAAQALVEVGTVDVRGASWLRLEELVTVSGPLTIAGTDLADLELPELASVDGDFVLRDNDWLAAVDLPRLATVEGDFVVEGNAVMGDLDQTLALDRVAGTLEVFDNGGMTALDGFRFATDLHGIAIHDNPSLVYVGGFELQTVLAGDIRVEDNALLRQLDAFDSLTELDGSLSIQRNAAFDQFHGFDNLAAITGDLTVQDNPVLPAVDASDFAGGVAVGGTTTVGNNGP